MINTVTNIRSSVIQSAVYGTQFSHTSDSRSKYSDKGQYQSLNVQLRRGAPNIWRMCLCHQWEVWEKLGECGGFKTVCAVNKYARAPWLWMPKEGERYNEINTIALPAVEGVETVVISHQVPPGYDGVIVNPVNTFTGSGFFEGSGDIVWRIRLNRYFAKDYGNIQTSLGSLTLPMAAQQHTIRLESNQIVQYTATLGTGALGRLDPAGRILCALNGWFYPQN